MRIVNTLTNHLLAMYREHLLHAAEYTYPQQMNVIAGKSAVPMGVLMTPTDWKLDIDGTTAKEQGTFRVYFLTTEKRLDFDAANNETFIDKMIDLALDYLKRLSEDKSLEITNPIVEGASVYDATDRNLTGCRLSLSLKETQGRCFEVGGRC